MIAASRGQRPGHTFRKPALVAFAWLIAAGVTAMWGFAASVSHGGGVFAAAIIFVAGVYVLWLLGGHSAVRLGADGVVVDNLLVRHVIPWGELAEIGVGNGLVFRLRDGSAVGSIMYGGSVIGAVLGYRYTRKVAAQMNAERERLVAGGAQAQGGSYQRLILFSLWPLLVIAAVMEILASLAFVK